MTAMADLDRLEQDLADVETALACIDTDRREVCDICRGARADASIAERPALAACAADKLPLEVPLDLDLREPVVAPAVAAVAGPAPESAAPEPAHDAAAPTFGIADPS